MHKLLKWFSLSLVILLALCSLNNHGAELKPLLQPLTVEQGLSRGTVRHLHIDQEGFLWIATSNGLNRFDATRNLIVGADNAKIAGQEFNQVFEHLPNQLWAVASQVGIFRIDKTTGTIKLEFDLVAQEQLELPTLREVLIEDEDHFLLAINSSVYRYSLKTGQLAELFNLRQANIELGWIGQLWRHQQQLLVGSNRGLFSLDLKTGQFHQIELASDQVRTNQRMVRHIYATNDQLFISAGTSLYQLSLANVPQQVTDWHFNRILTSVRVNRLLQHQGRLLMATSSGLFEYDPVLANAKFIWRFSQGNQEIGQDIITDLVATADGGLWLASRDEGVYYWHPRSTAFTNIKLKSLEQRGEHQQQLMLNLGAQALAEGDNNQLWVGSGYGLQLLDLSTGQFKEFNYPSDIPADFGQNLSRIYPETTDRLWLRSTTSLRYFSVTDRLFLPAPLLDESQQKLLTTAARGHWRDEQGDFWFYNLYQYYRYRPAQGLIEPLPGLLEKVPPQLAGRFLGTVPNQPQQVILSAHDQLWLYDAEQQQASILFQAADYQPALQRFADKMSVDPQGILWITFNGIGLLGFDPALKLVHHFHQQHQLLSNNVYSSELDDNGHLWFSGNYGLSRLDTQSLRIEHFSRKDGLASYAFNMGASTRLHNGDLVFGSRQGLTLVDASRFVEQPQAPRIAITAIRALDQAATGALGTLNGQKFRFHYNVPGVEVQFTSLNFRDSSKISYRLWLEGEQRLDYPDQTSPQIVFPQLQPGSYRFFVAAVSPMTGLESEPAQISLEITAAPWRTQTAYLSYSALMLLFTLLWWRNRRRQRRLLAQAHKKVKISEQRLKQALEAVDSGAWEWHSHKNSMFARRVHSMLGYSEALDPLTMQQHLSLVHVDDREAYQQAWQRFTSAPDKTFDHSYRMQHKNGHWLWFRDIGKVTELNGQKIERVIGTYSNITETRATKEKARLFGEAFQQTRDWVVLLDLEQRVIAANQSFSDVFGNMDEYLSNPRTHDLGISLNRRRFYTKLLAGMTVNQHWQGEELVQCPDGSERPTLINITAVGDDLQVEFFVLVFTDITAQKQAEDDLRYLASYDALTGLPNRALLMDRIYHGIEQAKRERRSLALCFIDLDKFKQINDSLGHDIGDLLLKKVAKRLTDTLRLTDTVARLGGDEFVVLLEAYKNDDNISHVARKMIKTVGEPMQLGAHTVSISPSIGIAVFPEDAHDAKELLKHADVAMYHAKDSGRNNFQFFINEMNEKAYMQLARETKLRSAYQQHEFFNFYQPIYDSRQQKVVGAEVLMRWLSDVGLVPPTEFIPLAEDLNLIIPMTLSLLDRALSDLQQWHQAGFSLYLSVNLSTRHLEQEDLAIQTSHLLQKYQLPASCLRFEVTESALMQDHESAIATMLALSELGIQLALDDFGTGYSSLKYLKELPIDAIKIDRSFVKDIGIDSNDETIIDAMLSMANSLGMYCIAEGVETEQQLAFFTQRQCYLIQGYLFGKPMPAAEFTARLASERDLV